MKDKRKSGAKPKEGRTLGATKEHRSIIYIYGKILRHFTNLRLESLESLEMKLYES